MSREDDAAAGIHLAQQAIHAAADGNDDQILELINAGTHSEVAWAAAYLVSCVREATSQLTKRNPRKTARALHAAANNMDDGLMIRLSLMINDLENGSG